MARSANPIAQALEHRALGHSQGFGLRGTGRGREGPGQQGHSCPELSRSVAPHWSHQALQKEGSVVTVGAESRAATATGVVPPGVHGLNNPH